MITVKNPRTAHNQTVGGNTENPPLQQNFQLNWEILPF